MGSLMLFESKGKPGFTRANRKALFRTRQFECCKEFSAQQTASLAWGEKKSSEGGELRVKTTHANAAISIPHAARVTRSPPSATRATPPC